MARVIQKDPETLNGVTFGAGMILVSLLWFAVPFMLQGRVLILPQIAVFVGFVTMVRHLFINAEKNKMKRARKKVVKRQIKLEPSRSKKRRK